ncbi:hypothetical protein MPC4_50050 [Methylocella tundrae]|uniref:Uncharacterized protein n=1 Tax=Methylocella tundrae TaxID=227605 RepID=A0A8B6MA32_METTU|nr:hypothetical protein MPC1_280009 [Methylocella tundrae]VTZ51742.1 hypothetical protein MPC4_50050 [Methylocella tundrae]
MGPKSLQLFGVMIEGSGRKRLCIAGQCAGLAALWACARTGAASRSAGLAHRASALRPIAAMLQIGAGPREEIHRAPQARRQMPAIPFPFVLATFAEAFGPRLPARAQACLCLTIAALFVSY